jgi:hypothetical protein
VVQAGDAPLVQLQTEPLPMTYGVILYLFVATHVMPMKTYGQWHAAGEFVSLRACTEAIKTLGVSDKEARCVLNYTTQ